MIIKGKPTQTEELLCYRKAMKYLSYLYVLWNKNTCLHSLFHPAMLWLFSQVGEAFITITPYYGDLRT